MIINNPKSSSKSVIDLLNANEKFSNITSLNIFDADFGDNSVIQLNNAFLNIKTFICKSSSFNSGNFINLTQNSSLIINNSDVQIKNSNKYNIFTLNKSNAIITNSIFDTDYFFISLTNSDFLLYSSTIKDPSACPDGKIADVTNSNLRLINTTPSCNLKNVLNYTESVSFCNQNKCKNFNNQCDFGQARYEGVCMYCPNNTYAVHSKFIDDLTCFECTNNMSCNANLIKPVPGV